MAKSRTAKQGVSIEGPNSENTIQSEVVGNELVIKVALAEEGVVSATGKTITIATTGGYKPLGGLVNDDGAVLFGNITIGLPNK